MKRFRGKCPSPSDLCRLMKVLGILDTVLSERPDLRYHNYIEERFPDVDVGVIDNGAGDDLFCFLTARGESLIKGFDHLSEVSPYRREGGDPWPGIYEEAPSNLLAYLEPPEFRKEDVTFCLWRGRSDRDWRQGDVKLPKGASDGSSFLLGTIFSDAVAYLDWAKDYYGREIPEEPVAQVYASGQVDRVTAQTLNPGVDIGMLRRQLKVMGLKLV
jgi:hypothetical protein